MKKYILDGNEFKTKNESYEYIKQVLELPEYVGKNLDALWDALTDLNNCEIEIVNARRIPRLINEYGLKMLDVFGDLANEKSNVSIKW